MERTSSITDKDDTEDIVEDEDDDKTVNVTLNYPFLNIFDEDEEDAEDEDDVPIAPSTPLSEGLSRSCCSRP